MDNGSGAGTILTIIGLIAFVVLGALAVNGCNSWAVDLEDAKAQRARAEAEAYQIRTAANEARRENGHQRALEMLPIILAVTGVVLALGLAGFAFWDIRSQQSTTGADNSALLTILERWQLEAAERDRALWRAIAELARRKPELPSGSREIVIYDLDQTQGPPNLN